jgi:hypothetical protein
MSSASDTSARSLRRLIVSIDYATTFVSLVFSQLSTPTSNDDAESKKSPPSKVSLMGHRHQETFYQSNRGGKKALFSRHHNLNRHIVDRNSESQFFMFKRDNIRRGVEQFRDKDHSMPKIGNHDRLDLARTDALLAIGATRDMIEEAEDFGSFVCAATLFTVMNRADIAL